MQAFVSYSRVDLLQVTPLALALRSHRLSVFFDQDSLRAGASWPDSLAHALRRCRALVLCWSAAADQSKWVHAEYRQALLLRKPILPWQLDSTPLPPELGQRQAVAGPAQQAADAFAKELALLSPRRPLLVAGGLVAASLTGWAGFHSFAPDPAATAEPQASGFSFKGFVQEAGSGALLKGVEVKALGVTTYSGDDGRYELRFVQRPPETFVLSVTYRGFAGQSIDVRSDIPDFGIVLERVNPK